MPNLLWSHVELPCWKPTVMLAEGLPCPPASQCPVSWCLVSNENLPVAQATVAAGKFQIDLLLVYQALVLALVVPWKNSGPSCWKSSLPSKRPLKLSWRTCRRGALIEQVETCWSLKTQCVSHGKHDTTSHFGIVFHLFPSRPTEEI